ncbi:hypothetical protein LIER_16224 [Lithospermum erythrorhizon]|uniref:Uncharacterized protein n=1 Tax=Lithospermum erythrorhizon TaxID=34254 RepID=A0AAV3Q5T9_LITER
MLITTGLPVVGAMSLRKKGTLTRDKVEKRPPGLWVHFGEKGFPETFHIRLYKEVEKIILLGTLQEGGEEKLRCRGHTSEKASRIKACDGDPHVMGGLGRTDPHHAQHVPHKRMDGKMQVIL